MQGRDRGLWNCTACDNSKPAFEFQSKIGAPNCVTARCHKRGTKRVDQVTGECECENFFEEKNCDTKQDVSTSMGLSYFITFLNICVCIWFLCFRGLQRVTDNMFTDSGDPGRWQINLQLWIREQQRINYSFREDKAEKARQIAEQPPAIVHSYWKAFVLIVTSVLLVIFYIAFDFFMLAINVYLIATSLGDFFFVLPGMRHVYNVMASIGDAIGELCDDIADLVHINVNFLHELYEFALDIASWFMDQIDLWFEFLSSGLTCSGAQAPLYVSLNLAI